MRTKNSLALPLVVSSLIISLLSTSPVSALTEVAIAYQGPLTGTEREWGLNQLNGAKFAVDKFNASSKSYKVNLFTFDDRGDPAVASKIAPQVVSNKNNVIGVVGPAYSAASIQSFPYFKAAGMVTLSPSASRASLTDPSSSNFGGPVFYRLAGVNHGASIAKHSIQGIKSPMVYLMVNSDSHFDATRSLLTKTLNEQSAKIIQSERLAFGVTDYSSQLAGIKKNGANVVIFIGDTEDAATFTTQYANAGLSASLSIGGIGSADKYISLAGKSAEGVKLTVEVLDRIDQASSSLAEEFKKSTGTVSGPTTLEAIDATNIFLSCIDQGNVSRQTLLKCVSTFKGKTALGSEISFEPSGDVIGAYSFIAQVKDSKVIFLDPVINQQIVNNTNTASSPRVSVNSISSNSITAGEKVSWSLELSVKPGWAKGVYFSLIDPIGQARQLFLDMGKIFPGYTISKTETRIETLDLQTHASLKTGKYWIANVCMEAEYRDCVSDPKFSSKYDPNGNYRQTDMSQFSFTVTEPKDGSKFQPLTISGISTTSSSVAPGGFITYTVEAAGTMRYTYAQLSADYTSLGGSTIGISAYCQPSYRFNCTALINKESNTTKFNFVVAIPKDLPTGTVKISSITLTSTQLPEGESNYSGNSTESWGLQYSYSQGALFIGGQPAPPSIEVFDFEKHNVTITENGNSQNRTPTWSSLSWATNKVPAGSEATLQLNVNGYLRNIYQIDLYTLVATSGESTNIRNQRFSRVNPESSSSYYPLMKNGSYEITFEIPRGVKPGFYRIGYLGIQATNCEAFDLEDLKRQISQDVNNCQGLSNWSTSYSYGYIYPETWKGSEDLNNLLIEILPAKKPEVPTLTLKSSSADTVKIEYPYNPEISCEFTSDTGTLMHVEVGKNPSVSALNSLIISDLEPDSPLKLTGKCQATDGLVSDQVITEFRSGKPAPPSAPKVLALDVGTDNAKIEFNYLEGFKYQAKTSNGEVLLSNGNLVISKIEPGTRVEVQLIITDQYKQSTTGETIILTTKKPAPPSSPKIELVSKSINRISLKTLFDPTLSYQFSVDKGVLVVSGNLLEITSLNPATTVMLEVTAKDRYGQFVVSKQTFETQLPPAPRAPTLRTTSTLSNEVNLIVSQPADTKLSVSTDRGFVTINGDRLKISGLSPKSTVTLTISVIDIYGQSSSIVKRTLRTLAATRQKGITCTNGSTSKVIVGVDPKCPAGYSKK